MRSITLDYTGCDAAAINSMPHCYKELKQAAEKACLTVVGEACHEFEGQGLSICLLLSESHLCIHTYPELGLVSVDIYTCGTTALPDAIINPLFKAFYAKEYTMQGQNRGVLV